MAAVELARIAVGAEAHRDGVAKAPSEITTIPLDIQTIAANRSAFVIASMIDEIIETEQAVADRYFPARPHSKKDHHSRHRLEGAAELTRRLVSDQRLPGNPP